MQQISMFLFFRPRASSEEKQFSRQNIQDKIDSVRQKWGITGAGAGEPEGGQGAPPGGGRTPRPKSYAGEGDEGEIRQYCVFVQ